MATHLIQFDYFRIMQELDKKPIKPVYLIYGEEEYLHNKVLEGIKDRFQKDNLAVNYETFYGENIDFNGLANSLKTLPLGGGKQCILIKQLDKVKGAAAKQLDHMMNRLSFGDDNFILLLFSFDKKIPGHISLDKIKQFGTIVFLQKLKSFQMKQWITVKCQENHKEISPEAVYYLQGLTDNDLAQVENELQKLFSYSGEGSSRISKDDIIHIFYGNAAANIFDFVDAIGDRRTDEALYLLHQLEKNEYHPLSLLAMINRQIRLILQVKYYHEDLKKLRGELHLPLFVLNRLIVQSKKYQLYELKETYPILLDAEISLKTGYRDPVTVLEQLVVSITE